LSCSLKETVKKAENGEYARFSKEIASKTEKERFARFLKGTVSKSLR
jgi:hypothetical protein